MVPPYTHDSSDSSSSIPVSSNFTALSSGPSSVPLALSKSSTSTVSSSSSHSLIAAAAAIRQSSMRPRLDSFGSSLFQICISLIDRLSAVHALRIYLAHARSASPTDTPSMLLSASAFDAAVTPHGGPDESSEESLFNLANDIDPVTQLWRFFRQGTSLCVLFNQVSAALVANSPTPISPASISSSAAPVSLSIPNPQLVPPSQQELKVCKRAVYDFILACKTNLDFSDEDLFTVTSVFSDDTSDLLKVTRTVNLVLNLWDVAHKGGLVSPADNSPPDSTDGMQAYDHRSKVILEILQTERKYVQDLERLQLYMNQLRTEEILPADTVHSLFPNLKSLVDFQRKFLVGLETNARLPPSQQHFGSLFVSAEPNFSVYETYASQQKRSTDLAIRESPKLGRLSEVIEPTYELPSLLIKPIQRICRYPLLLKELLKYTAETDENHQELVDGFHAMKRVTDRVNETQRKTENKETAASLNARIEDWKGHNIDQFGDLLLHGVYQMIEVDKEYHIYLFENILLFCKEEMLGAYMGGANGRSSSGGSLASAAGAVSSVVSNPLSSQYSGQSAKKKKHILQSSIGKKSSLTSFTSANSISSSTSLNGGSGGSLKLEGRVYVENLTDVSATSTKRDSNDLMATGEYILSIFWRFQTNEVSEANKFSIRFRNDEILRQWESTLKKLIMDRQMRHESVQSPSVFQSVFIPTHGHSASTSSFMSNVSSVPAGSRSTYSSSITGMNGIPEATGPSRPPGTLKLRLSFHMDTYMILLPDNVTFDSMVSKVEKKLRLCNGPAFEEMVATNKASGVTGSGGKGYRLKYRDEDGDMVVLEDSNDWDVALESGIEEWAVDMWIF
ncbi:uncharacterized protein V1516DRAFT_625666 [Lipomyces oligophaga]|uniref:uncharacterized protein n=1 Tax=Lipomyces oligophaga TaxID=45792 RepID=UPI0034CFAC27